MALTALSDTDLTDFLKKHAGNHFYFEPAWLNLITTLYGYTFIQLTTTNQHGQISGLLPLCYLQSPLTGRRLVSLPFSDYCPILADDAASTQSLIDRAIEVARQKRVRYLELRTGPNETLAGRTDLVASNLYARWLVELTHNPADTWSRLRPTARRKIKKARSQGVRFRLSDSREDMRAYYELHLLTRTRKHGMPSQSLAFFLRLWDTFAPTGQLHLELAEYEGKIIAAHITAFSGNTARYLYGAADEHYQDLAAGYLLTWESIDWACQHDYQVLDLGRTAYDNPGLAQFKRSWGAVEEACPYYYYPAISGLASTPENSRKYQLLTRLWKGLPLRISAPLGGYLYRHLG